MRPQSNPFAQCSLPGLAGIWLHAQVFILCNMYFAFPTNVCLPTVFKHTEVKVLACS